jgi:hypothetical protein
MVRERWRGGGGVVRERESRMGGGCKACFWKMVYEKNRRKPFFKFL